MCNSWAAKDARDQPNVRSRSTRAIVAAALIGVACIAASPSAGAAPAVTYHGAFELEGIAGHRTGKSCSGAGAWGEANPGAKVTISERNAAGDFSVLATGKLAKGKVVKASSGDKVCRMKFVAKAATAPASDSTVYFEMKGLTFNVRLPAADVADGNLGTLTCAYSATGLRHRRRGISNPYPGARS